MTPECQKCCRAEVELLRCSFSINGWGANTLCRATDGLQSVTVHSSSDLQGEFIGQGGREDVLE